MWVLPENRRFSPYRDRVLYNKINIFPVLNEASVAMESVGRGDVKKADLMTYAAPALSQHFGRYMKALIASLVIPVICISVTPCAANPVQFPSRFSGGDLLVWQ